jgi:hypothetical protein
VLLGDEITDDPTLLKQTSATYHIIEESTTTGTIIFPWLPLPARIKRIIAGGWLFPLLKGIVENRKRQGIHRDDALQVLIDHGDVMSDIIAIC